MRSGGRGDGDDDEHRELQRRIGRAEDRIRAIERFQSWLVGLGVGGGTVIGIFIESIKKKLGF